jgi:hypothetical protein
MSSRKKSIVDIARWMMALTVVMAVPLRAAETAKAETFAALVERLSEPGGDFGGDNLISNEQSYLQVMTALEDGRVSGGAYLGVGPDQNFSYIAQVKPAFAYIVDIRRDNLLLLLLFKAIFAEAPTRVGYLSLLTGRPVPERAETWKDATIDTIIAYIDKTPALPAAEQERLRKRFEAVMAGFKVPITADEFGAIESSRRQFVAEGLSLVFQARGQPKRSYYPTLRTLLRETDRKGRQLSFLATEDGYQFVRALQQRDGIVPVVGDFSGPKAMRAIAADMNQRGLKLSAFYTSNVEYYLFRARTFGKYAENVQGLPADERSLVIRSVFPSGGVGRPAQSVPGHYSSSIVQSFPRMLEDIEAGKYRSYLDLIVASGR